MRNMLPKDFPQFDSFELVGGTYLMYRGAKVGAYWPERVFKAQMKEHKG